ncbi:TDP-N-acetylfucosamine:lipid II N-acetylfucosaminyltransferase [Lutibacter sp.]
MNEFKIIHIFNDDKFIDPAIKLIEEVYPNQSTYFIIQTVKKPFKYVKFKKAKTLLIHNKEDEAEFVNYLQKSKVKVVFFHALDIQKQRLVNLLDDKIVKVWFIWGFDFYQSWGLINIKLYEPETSNFLYSQRYYYKKMIIFNNFSFWLFSKFKYRKYLLPKKINNILDSNYLTEFYKATKKIDILVPVVPTEYSLVNKIGISPTFAPFTYGCLEDILGDKIEDNVLKSKNILIGNSANPTNNHVDIFEKISKFNLKDRKIYVPLNYSGSSEYIDFVKEKGYHYFGDKFVPVLNFMPLNEYNKLLLSCGFVLFNHIRQQAVGNLITMGYLGAKIFLNKRSPVYKYYKGLGVNIYNLNELNENNLKSNLIIEDVNINKNLFFKIYSRDSVHSKVRKLLEIVQNELTNK